jgi:GNAT superfamily N-acetyltransferase
MHARDPNWVPPLRMEVATLLDRAKNPFFQHATADWFLAERDGQVVGRIAAIHNHLHNEVHEDKVGFFGFFECVDDQGVATRLLAEAERWIRERGLDTLRGPASFSVNDECGLLVDGFATPNVVMMPHNPRYYQRLIEGAGFTKAKDLLAYQGGNAAHPVDTPDRLKRAVRLILERYGITVRTLDMSRFEAEVDLIKKLYNEAWEKNWGFVPMTDAEIELLAKNFKPVIIPQMVIFAEQQGRPVGFGLAIPDLNEALRTNRNGGIVKGALQILWWKLRKKFTRARIPLLGVIPEFRGKGIDSALYHEVWAKAGTVGIGWGEGGWILEDNPAMKLGLEKMGFVVYKTYRMYDRAVRA